MTGPFREVEIVLRVCPAHPRGAVTVTELLEPVFTHGLEHLEPQPVTDSGTAQKAHVDERFQPIENRAPRGITNGFGRFERAAAGEHRELLDEDPIVLTQQLVTPVECRPQRLLASRQIGAAGRQQVQARRRVCPGLPQG